MKDNILSMADFLKVLGWILSNEVRNNCMFFD